MLDYLHHHHVGEDEGVWPRTVAKRPDLQQMVDEMEAEHKALAAASDGLRAAAAEFARDGSDAKRRALAGAVTRMQEATLPHLDHEEQVAMPLVLETLDDDDWAYLEKNYFRKGISLSNAARMFMWLLDDLDVRRTSSVKGELPGPSSGSCRASTGLDTTPRPGRAGVPSRARGPRPARTPRRCRAHAAQRRARWPHSGPRHHMMPH